MGDDDERETGSVEHLEEPEHLGCGLAVEVARRLVRENERGLVGECPGDGHALALTPRECRREVVGPIGEAHPVEQLPGSLPRESRSASSKEDGEFDILLGGELLHEVERLEDKANVLLPHHGERALREPVDAASTEPQLTGGWPIEPAEQMKERRLATPAGPHHHEGFTARDIEVDPVDSSDQSGASAIVLAQTAGTNDGRLGTAHCVVARLVQSEFISSP